MGGVEPVAVQAVGHVWVLGTGHCSAVQQVARLCRGVARHVLDQSVTFAVTCINAIISYFIAKQLQWAADN